MAGVYNIPFNLMSIVGGFGGGILMGITKEAKGIVVGSFVLLLIGSGLMPVMKPSINFAAWCFPTGLLGCGVGAQAAIIRLPPSRVERFLMAVASGRTDELVEIPGVTGKVLEAFQSMYVSGLAECYRYVWYAITPFCAAALVLSFFVLSTKA
ncbi:hypothetical protein CEP54_013804 [Fusarium duplospermum]|uniref:Uncharacterized protein n=1 Tax=Fusarium duplospermum TaxID=1325734 RepID=A0A428P0C2_9HYPO|nr:hypothetical protein CEP54_013804 [Fusarium duplospermum]